MTASPSAAGECFEVHCMITFSRSAASEGPLAVRAKGVAALHAPLTRRSDEFYL